MKGLQRSIWVLMGLVVGVACLWVWGPVSLQAGAITVCPVGCDYDTVQGAVNAAAPLSTILISPATYTETVVITKSLTLEGVGQPQPVVSGNDAGRPFTILGSVAVTMTHITVTRGRAPVDPDGSARGGGIFNQGQLTLDHVIISDNQAISDDGDNSAINGRHALGGGLYSICASSICGSLTLNHTQVISNTAQGGNGIDGIAPPFAGYGGDGNGGGVVILCNGNSGTPCGTLELADSTIAYNVVHGGTGGDQGLAYFPGGGGSGYGAGLYYVCHGPGCANLTLTRIEVHHNKAQAGDGGDTPVISGGSGPSHSYGGGLYLGGVFTLSAGNIHHNEVRSSDFYVVINPYALKRSSGGGIDVSAANSVISTSTIWQNEADMGGGMFIHFPEVWLNTSTLSQNTARECGGAIYYRHESNLRLDYVTIAENIANGYANPRGCGDQWEYGAGGGVYILPYFSGLEAIELKSSILADNHEPNHYGGDCYGKIYSQGFNLIENPDRCTIVGHSYGNILDRAASLGPLQDNEGLTPTHALLTGSLAIDAAAPADCPNTDQRQYPRWVDGNGDGIERCDMGAYEYGGAPTDVGRVGEVRGRVPFPSLILALISLVACFVLITRTRKKGT